MRKSDVFMTTGNCLEYSGEEWRPGRACMGQDMMFKFCCVLISHHLYSFCIVCHMGSLWNYPDIVLGDNVRSIISSSWKFRENIQSWVCVWEQLECVRNPHMLTILTIWPHLPLECWRRPAHCWAHCPSCWKRSRWVCIRWKVWDPGRWHDSSSLGRTVSGGHQISCWDSADCASSSSEPVTGK